MTIEISSEDQEVLQRLMEAGRFSSIGAVVHETIQLAMAEQSPTQEYLTYLDSSIREGLEDADAGRTVPHDEVLAVLRAAQTTEYGR